MSALWTIGPISTPRLQWGEIRHGHVHKCPTCNVVLLTGESPGFCCGPQGSKFNEVQPLPPLPEEYNAFINHPDISQKSRLLNLIFSFASLETTHAFPDIAGPPGFVAIQGKIYHRIRPTHQNSAVRWLLHDGFMMNTAPHQDSDWASALPEVWKCAFREALLRVNPFVTALRNLSALDSHECPHAHLVLDDTGSTAEIAAIMSYDNTTQSQIKSRRWTISRTGGTIQSIPTISRLWEPLAYPLLFPNATLGWGIVGSGRDIRHDVPSDPTADRPTTQMWHYRARLLREPRFQIFGRLTNEYIVDMFTCDLETRLNYIRANQLHLRREDAALMGVDDLNYSENVYLPSSFLGSNRWASEQIADSLAIAASCGNPTFFVTITCNPDWPEITSQLRPGQSFADIPVTVVRVFKRKLTLLQHAIRTMFTNAGRQVYMIHCVEFQKRGLPHAHILVKFANDCTMPDDIDLVVSAEIPACREDAALVRKFMLHHHPREEDALSKYCQREKDGRRFCRFGYPHSLQCTTTIDNEGRIHYRR